MISQFDDDAPLLGKFAKDYDTIARQELLSVRFQEKSFKNVPSHAFFKNSLKINFNKRQDYKITHMEFALVVAQIPTQGDKTKQYHVEVQHEIIKVVGTQVNPIRRTP